VATRGAAAVRNFCFVCGPANAEGMRLRFELDAERREVIGHLRLPRRYQGPPGHLHGGLIATLLDEVMGKLNRLWNVVALTRRLDVHYLRPVPLNRRITVLARPLRRRGRTLIHQAKIQSEDGETLATARGWFVIVDAEKMFARWIRKQ
jgi:uncharacterized protein (TIGR00369 family)